MIFIPTGLLYLAVRSTSFAGGSATSKENLKYSLSRAWFMLVVGVIWTGFLEGLCGYEIYFTLSQYSSPLDAFDICSIWVLSVFIAIAIVMQVYIIRMYIKDMIPIYRALRVLGQTEK